MVHCRTDAAAFKSILQATNRRTYKQGDTSDFRSVRLRTSDVHHFALMEQAAQAHLETVRVIPAT
jgi:hypothetical protein